MKRFLAVLLVASALLTSNVYADEPSVWAVDDVRDAYNLGIAPDSLMTNYSSNISRRDFCTLCARTLRAWGVESDKTADNYKTFSDITKDDEDIVYCASLGVVSGVGNGKFEPDRSITRQEAAKMLYNALAVTGLSDENSGILLPHVFNDGDKISAWARNEIYAVYHTGVMMGDTENRFNPTNSYTREQAICTLWRLYKLADNKSLNVNPEIYMVGKYEDSLNRTSTDINGYYLNMAYRWYEGEKENYEPQYIDGFGNRYTASEVGYVYPVSEKYMEVLTYVGVGVHAETIINKNRDDVTSGCSIDKIYSVNTNSLFADYATVYGDYANRLVDLETGEYVIVDGAEDSIKAVGCGMYINGNPQKGYCFLNSDLVQMTSYKYSDCGYTFLNNMLVAVATDGTVDIINTDGKILKTTKIDLNKYSVYNIYGTNVILNYNRGESTDIWRVGSDEYIKGYTDVQFLSNGEISAKKNNITYILDINGKVKYSTGESYSDIYGCSAYHEFRLASKTSKTAPYIAEPYDVINTNGKVVVAELTSDNIITDGGGVFCGRRNNEFVVFDKDGVQLGTITPEGDVDEYQFINGLIRVRVDNKHIYYLPNGSKADFINSIIN